MTYHDIEFFDFLSHLGREHVGCMSDRIFTSARYTHIDFIQDNNDVGRLACLLN
jgi:hypothetical protein